MSKDLRWKPKEGEYYWYIDLDNIYGFDIVKVCWLSKHYNGMDCKLGNCFKTKKEAQTMLKDIKYLLKSR